LIKQHFGFCSVFISQTGVSTCDKGDSFEIQKSRKEQKNVEQSLCQASIHTTNRYHMFDL